LDHFIAARSFKLQAATSLEKRPFLHNSLFLIISNTILVFIDKKFSLLFFVSWFSHHIRDANRRGLWLGSLYTTSPINDGLYLTFILLTPLLLRYFYSSNFIKNNNESILRFLINSYSKHKTVKIEEIQLV
ncbi:unnamed protein product, partial [Brachionus calyciflorus]